MIKILKNIFKSNKTNKTNKTNNFNLTLYKRQFDGFKTGKSKILECCFKFSLKESIDIISVSGKVFEVTGYNPHQFTSNQVRFENRIHQDDNDILSALVSKDMLKNSGSINLRFRQANYKIRCILCHFKKTKKNDSGEIFLELIIQDAKSLWQNSKFSPEFESMMINANDYIYFKDRNHVFTGASQTLVNLTTPTKHWTDLLGKTDYDVFNETLADSYYALEKRVFSGETVAHEIQETIDNDNKKGWVDNRKFPIRDRKNIIVGLYGIARDITESKLISKTLESSEKQFRTIFEKAPLGIGLINSITGQIININDKYKEIIGWENFNPEKISWQSITHPDDLDKDLRLMDELISGRITNFKIEKRLIKPDDSIIWVNLTVASLPSSNKFIKQHLAMIEDISERKNLLDQIKITKHVLTATQVGTYDYDINSNKVSYSAEWFAMLGYKPNEFPATLQTWVNLLHPEDRNKATKLAQDFTKDLIPSYQTEFRLKKKDGTFLWVFTQGDIIERNSDGLPKRMVGIHLNIHERRQYLRAHKEFLKSNFIYWQFDPRTEIYKIDTNFLYKLGYTEQEKPKKIEDVLKMLHPDDHKIFVDAFQHKMLLEGNVKSVLYRIISKSGEIHWLLDEGQVVEYDENGKPMLAIGIALDVTDQKRNEEIENKHKEFEKDISIGKIASFYAHEFNNPLQGIMGLASIIDNYVKLDDKDAVFETTQSLRKEIKRLGDLVKTMADHYLPTKNKKKFVDIHRLIEEVLILFNFQITKSKIEIKKIFSHEDLKAIVVEDHIKQVVINILKNSIEAKTSNNSSYKIELETKIKESFFEIVISDNGDGIPADKLSKIFEQNTSEKTGGTGLGLYISNQIVMAHGGELTVTSKKNFGTSFMITMPYE